MKTNKPKLKNTNIQHSNKSITYNECCTRHKNTEYVFLV